MSCWSISTSHTRGLATVAVKTHESSRARERYRKPCPCCNVDLLSCSRSVLEDVLMEHNFEQASSDEVVQLLKNLDFTPFLVQIVTGITDMVIAN